MLAVIDSTSPDSLWNEILDLTAAIREKAVAGEWEESTALDTERRARLERFFSSPPKGELALRVSEEVLHILESDRQVMELARQMRLAIGDELHQIRKGHKAVGVYLDQTGE